MIYQAHMVMKKSIRIMVNLQMPKLVVGVETYVHNTLLTIHAH